LPGTNISRTAEITDPAGLEADLVQLQLELILMLMDYRRFMLVIQIWLMVIMN
jgi:hypothetical protein